MRIFFSIFIASLFLNSCVKDYKQCRSCGCNDVKNPTGTLTVDSLTFFIPKIFTPNGDGVNDLFMPVCDFQKIKSVKFEILSRDKKRILYKTESITGFWDGKDQSGDELGERIFAWKMSGQTTWDKGFDIEGEIFLFRQNCYSKNDGNSCLFADQIVPTQGFVLPTAEKKCD